MGCSDGSGTAVDVVVRNVPWRKTHDMAAAAPAAGGRRFRPRGLLRPPPRCERCFSCWLGRVVPAADTVAECGAGRTIMGCCRWCWCWCWCPVRGQDADDGREDVSGRAAVVADDRDLADGTGAGDGGGAGGGAQSWARRTTNALSNPGLAPTCKIISSDVCATGGWAWYSTAVFFSFLFLARRWRVWEVCGEVCGKVCGVCGVCVCMLGRGEGCVCCESGETGVECVLYCRSI